jgi:hypothetical protein
MTRVGRGKQQIGLDKFLYIFINIRNLLIEVVVKPLMLSTKFFQRSK